MPLVEMRAYLEENVVNAALAIFDDRPGSEVRSRLLDHVDQRFRLRYLMGEGLPGGAVAGPAGELSLADQMRENTEAILTQIHQLLEEAVTGELGAMVQSGAGDRGHARGGAARPPQGPPDAEHDDHRDHRLPRLRGAGPRRVAVPATTSSPPATAGPSTGVATADERDEFLTDLRRFAGNDATEFGTLLTPLVNGLRVRGPFHPDWAAEIPYVMLIDREGLGHTPDSVSSLPSSTTRMLDEVDTIVLVDNAQQPMQAAPMAAIRQIAAAGYGDKLVLCFTHFEMVHGPNLLDTDARRHHVIASVDQVLSAIGNELGYPTERLLRQRLDRNLYLLSRLNTDLGDDDDAETLAELRWLLGQLRVEAEPLDLGASRPVYSAGKLTMAMEDAIAAYLRYWELRLGVGLRPDDPAGPLVEDQGAVRPLRPSRQRRVRVDAAGRRPARPPSPTPCAASPPSRSRGAPEVPDEDVEQQNYDALTRAVTGELRGLVNDRLFVDAADLWAEARDVERCPVGPAPSVRWCTTRSSSPLSARAAGSRSVTPRTSPRRSPPWCGPRAPSWGSPGSEAGRRGRCGRAARLRRRRPSRS